MIRDASMRPEGLAVMNDYQIQPNSRRCFATGRELHPGEPVYSVLIEEGGKFLRREFSKEAWRGPPPDAFGYWLGKVQANERDKRPPIDDEMLLDCFIRLEGQEEPARVSFRYVVALLLMRRKRLKFEDVRTDGGREVLRLRNVKDRLTYEVVNPSLSDEEMESVQDEVLKVLGW